MAGKRQGSPAVCTAEVLNSTSSPDVTFSDMRGWWRPLAILVVIALVALGVRHVLNKRAEQRRDAAYQVILHSYTELLRPGMTRREVDDYLGTKKIEPRLMCCVDPQEITGVWDELVKIGQEDVPWFCSEHNVYVAFQFTGPRHASGWDANAADKLKAVTLYRQLEGCL